MNSAYTPAVLLTLTVLLTRTPNQIHELYALLTCTTSMPPLFRGKIFLSEVGARQQRPLTIFSKVLYTHLQSDRQSPLASFTDQCNADIRRCE